MKHHIIDRAPDTTDLERALRLGNLKPATRAATIRSLRAMRDAAGTDGHLSIDEIRGLVAEPTPELRAALGTRASQVLSDCRRALRAWDDPATQWRATQLSGPVPMLDIVPVMARAQFSADEAQRVENAILALAAAHDTTPDQMPATIASIEPLLRAATPETFGVSTVKSLENKCTLVRKGLRLVDPTRTRGRAADERALPQDWRDALALVAQGLKKHETSIRAICRRLALFGHAHGAPPAHLPDDLVTAFVAQERATHAAGYDEKLRAAFARWNAAAELQTGLAALLAIKSPQHRQETVRWSDVPPAFREPLDARLQNAMSARSPSDWGALVPDVDDDYADLGLCDVPPQGLEAGALVIEAGTAKNWRNAVKRVWHAAMEDPRVDPKPETFADLFDLPCARAAVAAVRGARRDRLEAEGETFDPKTKERYDHSLIEAFVATGRAVGISPDRLAPVDDFARSIDPAIVGWKRSQETMKPVYADRKIGRRHAQMVAAFSDAQKLKRWFEAPSVLWAAACKPLREGRKPKQAHVALARSALIARIGQYVGPMRRTNFARLRYRGDDPQLLLPAGAGEGTLRIPPIETKTIKEIHVRIDAETVRMIKYYIAHFLPVAQKTAGADPHNPHLFPGADGREIADGGYASGFGYLTKVKLNNAFRKHLRKYCGIDLCLHVMRHLAGKVILDQDPSAMELVRQLLGHKRIETTRSYYAEVSALVAQDRYLHLLDRGARRVLADIRFSFVDPQDRRSTKDKGDS